MKNSNLLIILLLTLAQASAAETPERRVLFKLPAAPLAITNSDLSKQGEAEGDREPQRERKHFAHRINRNK